MRIHLAKIPVETIAVDTDLHSLNRINLFPVGDNPAVGNVV